MVLSISAIALLVVVTAVGLYMAWNIGANDVANALGTSVGSHALTLKQAILVAAVFEFAGAVLVGSHVTQTIQKGMIDIDLFVNNPMILVYGMGAALLASGIWIQIATATGWPVSTTHSIVGGVVGFGIAAGGMGAVHWDKMYSIFASWVVSPILGALLAFLTFVIIRNRILDVPHPILAVRRTAPALIIPIIYILTLSLFYKGLNNLHLGLGFGAISGIGIAVGLAAAAVAALLVRRAPCPENPSLEESYEFVERRVFAYLQVMSACFVAFAHGSNDVANSVGPMAAIFNVVTTGTISSSSPVPVWMLLVGGAGIVVGLATWGYKVIATIGTQITSMTPTRGFAAEFGTALTILLGSKLGLPISTTHVLVGAVIGVGLARGMAALNMKVVRSVVESWLITVPFCAGLTMLLFYLTRFLMQWAAPGTPYCP